ncbi:MAG: hypothetical protein QOA14_02820 [Nitrososphaeraceae archaeon]|nr:hypothetical protein [Nitrososphaeraceae archaeon]MDW0201537.1 hypothetical protein [Nitrososphaeraceae archaeon]MDW0272381.1 hypothetical protein [Nitrososphaeraceae archaeon]MDW0274689.1 hypothetical protein [Nitrososphaeraceae archaeon]MDW0322775.1 hypothetical protein [Nitrososphaeraceae archaeon]
MNFERPLLFGLSGTLVLLIMFISIEHGVYAISISIESPLSNQQVPVGELKISGISSDNSSAQCQVYVDWNNLKPYQLATPTGSNGSSDFSTWSFTYTSKYHLIQTGLNDLTSKITCLVPPTGPAVTKWFSINVTGSSSPNQTSNVQLPLPTANNKGPSSASPQTSSPQTETPIDTTNTSSPQTETPIDTTDTSNSDKIALDLIVEHNPISAGDRQTVSLTASDPVSGNTLDRVFLRLTIKDPSGNIIKDYTDNDGKLEPSFRIDEDVTGAFSVLASASQAGIETTKSMTFVVQ